MDYQLHYDLLIRKAQERDIDGYFEKHHIIPRAFGGANDDSNLVKLTAKEHFIAHLLLYKAQTEKRKRHQMLTACVMMKGKNIQNSKMYKSAREEFSKLHSESISGENSFWYGSSRSGEQNPFYGKTHTKKVKDRMSKKAKGKVVAKNKLTGEVVKISKDEFDSNSLFVGITSNVVVPEERKNKISASMKARGLSKGKCVHCGKEMDMRNLTRHHNNNCKHRKTD